MNVLIVNFIYVLPRYKDMLERVSIIIIIATYDHQSAVVYTRAIPVLIYHLPSEPRRCQLCDYMLLPK